MLYAEFGKGMFPSFFKENLQRRRVLKKVLLFGVLIVGIALVRG